MLWYQITIIHMTTDLDTYFKSLLRKTRTIQGSKRFQLELRDCNQAICFCKSSKIMCCVGPGFFSNFIIWFLICCSIWSTTTTGTVSSWWGFRGTGGEGNGLGPIGDVRISSCGSPCSMSSQEGNSEFMGDIGRISRIGGRTILSGWKDHLLFSTGRRRRRKTITSAARRPRKATPPRVPPMIAPRFFLRWAPDLLNAEFY